MLVDACLAALEGIEDLRLADALTLGVVAELRGLSVTFAERAAPDGIQRILGVFETVVGAIDAFGLHEDIGVAWGVWVRLRGISRAVGEADGLDDVSGDLQVGVVGGVRTLKWSLMEFGQAVEFLMPSDMVTGFSQAGVYGCVICTPCAEANVTTRAAPKIVWLNFILDRRCNCGFENV